MAAAPTCTSTPVAGGSASTIVVSGLAVSVNLAAGDTVRCTFVNTSLRPQIGELFLLKVTKGNIGTFDFDVDGFGTRTIETEHEGIAHVAPPFTGLVPGNYRITETLPDSDAGRWRLVDVSCNGEPKTISGGNSVLVNVPETGGQACTFTDRFRHAGAIRITKTTLNGTGTMRFQVRPAADPELEYQKVATTREPGVRVNAVGDRTRAIPLGKYEIQETTASEVGDDGKWRVVRVECDGAAEPSESGRIVVRLTTDNPKVHCHYVNELVRDDRPEPPPVPPEPPPPSPPETAPDGGVLPESASRFAELRVTKIGAPRRITLGERARYRVVVRNLGPATARSVVLAEHGAAQASIVRGRASKGSCRTRPPRFCSLGNLRSGQRVVITIVAVPRRLGRLGNVVAVHTGTPQRTRRGKVARAAVVVVPRPVPRFTG